MTVNNRPTGCGFPARRLTDRYQEGMVDLLSGLLLPPIPEVMIGQLPGHQVGRKETPSAAGAQHIPDAVDDLSA